VKRTCLAVVLVLTAGCTHPAQRPPKPVAHERPVAAALTAFGDCDALTAALRTEAVKEVDAYGLPASFSRNDGRVYRFLDAVGRRSALVKAALGAAVPHSGTTLQEADVDEPDSVKTGGSVMVVSTGSAATLEVLDVTRRRPARLGSLLLHLNRAQLLLDGDRVVALGQVYRGGRVVTVVEIVDISDPATPTAVRRFRLDGSLLDGRVLHGRVVVAVSSSPRLRFTHPADGSAKEQARALAVNRAVARRATVDDLLPSVSVTPGGGSFRAGCTSALRPGVASGLQRTSLITLDPAKDRPTQHVTVVGSASTLYASGTALYLATQVAGTTDLHGFDVTRPDHLAYLGTGTVPGDLPDQYAMSEQDGYLRVATSNGGDNRITVLKPTGGALKEVAHVGGLGVGQQLYGVRFLGDLAYVVTFRRLDPLHVVDLSDPTRPVARGELTVPGYSSALYDLGNHLLLGLGQDLGSAASVFDTRDSLHPTLVSKLVLLGYSAAETDHHALLWWPATRNLALPLGRDTAVLTVSSQGMLRRQGVVRGQGGQVLRTVVVGDLLYSVSERGLTTAPLERLDETTWLPFP
jgi:uncharacterized secreted protein with C-terminal beta-propeller domain